jgi:hypothetical protein
LITQPVIELFDLLSWQFIPDGVKLILCEVDQPIDRVVPLCEAAQLILNVADHRHDHQHRVSAGRGSITGASPSHLSRSSALATPFNLKGTLLANGPRRRLSEDTGSPYPAASLPGTGSILGHRPCCLVKGADRCCRTGAENCSPAFALDQVLGDVNRYGEVWPKILQD